MNPEDRTLKLGISICKMDENLLMRQMGASLRPATLKNFTAAHITLAGEEAVLSFTLSLGWLVLHSA